ncbi:MAG: endolytic transglycosylase MltG [Butyrivibrio sp.]|nr:endolytic transglycosylase MltG [Butyrivibrio sp.]
MNSRQLGVSIVGTIIKAVVAIVAVMLIYRYAMIAYSYGYQIYNQQPLATGEGRSVSISISESDSVSDIGTMLVNKGLISDKKLFWLQERLSEYHGMIKPGTYELSTAMTPDEMMQIMAGAADAKSDKTAKDAAASDEAISGTSEITDDTQMQNADAGDEDMTENEDSAMGESMP